MEVWSVPRSGRFTHYLFLILRGRVGPTAGPDEVVDIKMPAFAGIQILTIVRPHLVIVHLLGKC
jgi:hypothetical protein